MKHFNFSWIVMLLLAGFSGGTVLAQEKSSAVKQADSVGSGKDIFQQMLSFSAPGKHHAMLEGLSGKWSFQDQRLAFVKGTIERKAIYEGRFFIVEMTGGKLQIPVADGKMKEANYMSMQVEGYDNVKEKFVTISINDHIGSDIQMQTGVYEPATKSFIYEWDDELTPGMKTRNRRVLKMTDADHYTEEYFEVGNGTVERVRGLDFVRVKGK